MEDGRAVGVEATSDRGTVRVRGNRGVMFATGGFAHNEELIARHQKMLYGACARPTATGDFILIAGAVGAQIGDLQSAWRTQVVLEEARFDRYANEGHDPEFLRGAHRHFGGGGDHRTKISTDGGL